MRSYIEISWVPDQEIVDGKPIGLPWLMVKITIGLLDSEGNPLRNSEGKLKCATGEYMLLDKDLREGYSIWNFIEEAVSRHEEHIPDFIAMELRSKSDKLQ